MKVIILFNKLKALKYERGTYDTCFQAMLWQ
jgi:hypothetical protein